MIVNKEDRVFSIYQWYLSILGKPKKTKCLDFNKSYTYRAVAKFVDLVDKDLKLSDRPIKMLIAFAVKYANNNHLMNKGASLLTNPAVFEFATNQLINYAKEERNLLLSLIKTKDILMNNETYDHIELSYPITYGGYSKLVYYYSIKSISIEFLALSKICRKTMKILDASDLSQLPNLIELEKIRVKLTVDKDIVADIQNILGSDLIK